MYKIALAQMTITPEHPADNIRQMKNMITKAVAQKAKLIIFPAMTVSGSLIGRSGKNPAFLSDCQTAVAELTKFAKGIALIFGSLDETGRSTIFICDEKARLKKQPLTAAPTALTVNGKKLLLKTDSVPYHFGKISRRHKQLGRLALKNNSPLLYVNSTGIQNTGKVIYSYDGTSAVYNADGKPVKILPSFQETLDYIDLDNLSKLPDLTVKKSDNIADICQAITSAVKCFLTSIRLKKVVIGISGGIDSAVSAALYASILPPEDIYLVNLPSRFNSSLTKDLARTLAKNLGCNYAVYPIQESVDLTVSQLENIPFQLNGKKQPLTVSSFVKENIQARDRSARVLAAVSAAVGGGFTCNANKAESTVGYSTMYGDLAGFLCALADLWKYQIYELAQYLNDEIYKKEVIPQGTIDIVPSAELSTDQNVNAGKGDPLVYPYHDYLFRAFTEKRPGISPEELLIWYLDGSLAKKIGCQPEIVSRLFPTKKAFIADLERWWQLYKGMAVAKRIQSPPLIAISRHPAGAESEPQNGVYYSQKYQQLKNK